MTDVDAVIYFRFIYSVSIETGSEIHTKAGRAVCCVIKKRKNDKKQRDTSAFRHLLSPFIVTEPSLCYILEQNWRYQFAQRR